MISVIYMCVPLFYYEFMENFAFDQWWFGDDFCLANCESLLSSLLLSWSC